jgi:hypothetical protein
MPIPYPALVTLERKIPPTKKLKTWVKPKSLKILILKTRLTSENLLRIIVFAYSLHLTSTQHPTPNTNANTLGVKEPWTKYLFLHPHWQQKHPFLQTASCQNHEVLLSLRQTPKQSHPAHNIKKDAKEQWNTRRMREEI